MAGSFPQNTLRAFGPLNGTMPEPTRILVGHMRDPSKMPYLRYSQFVPAPDVNFFYSQLDPDDPVRLTDLNSFAWAWDDYRPSGRGFAVKVTNVPDAVQRWNFPWQLGEQTISGWRKSGINVRQIYDRTRMNHAHLHRAVRVLNQLTTSTFPAVNQADMNTLLQTSGAYFDRSSGQQYLVDGSDNPNFQIIKKAFQRVKRRIGLSTNSAITGEEMIAILPPRIAEAIAVSGEMIEFLKQSQYARGLIDYNMENWNLPDSYGGFKLVVEDTPRCFINQNSAGTVGDVTIPAQKDYILTGNQIIFVSRPGGLDADFGGTNFSTVQIYTLNGEAEVQAFTEPKHELVEGHIVLKDIVETPAMLSGFLLSNVISPTYQASV